MDCDQSSHSRHDNIKWGLAGNFLTFSPKRAAFSTSKSIHIYTFWTPVTTQFECHVQLLFIKNLKKCVCVWQGIGLGGWGRSVDGRGCEMSHIWSCLATARSCFLLSQCESTGCVSGFHWESKKLWEQHKVAKSMKQEEWSQRGEEVTWGETVVKCSNVREGGGKN